VGRDGRQGLRIVLGAQRIRLERGVAASKPGDTRYVVDRMNLAGRQKRARIGRKIARKKRRHERFALVDEIPERTREIPCPEHDEQLDVVVYVKTASALERLLVVELRIERNNVHRVVPVADLEAAAGVEPFLPYDAAMIARLAPGFQWPREGGKKADMQNTL